MTVIFNNEITISFFGRSFGSHDSGFMPNGVPLIINYQNKFVHIVLSEVIILISNFQNREEARVAFQIL